MARGWVVLALAYGVASARLAHADPPCQCNLERLLPSGGDVPIDTKAWLIGVVVERGELTHDGIDVEVDGHPIGARPESTRFDLPDLAPHTAYTLVAAGRTTQFTTGSGRGASPAAPADAAVAITLADRAGSRKPVAALSAHGATPGLLHVSIDDGNGVVDLIAVPDLGSCVPGFELAPGTARIAVRAIDLSGRESPPATVTTEIAVDRDANPASCTRHYNDHGFAELGLILITFCAAVGGMLGYVVVVVIRRLRAPTEAPVAVPLLVAEQVARIVIAHQLIAIAIGVVMAGAIVVSEFSAGAFASLLVIGPAVIDAMAARGALRRMDKPGAVAHLCGKVLVVTADRRSSKLVASFRTIARACKRGVPTGTAR